MKYLCLVFSDEKALSAMPQHELDALMRSHLAYDEELRAGGHLVAAEALEPVRAATLLRVRSGRLVMADGPCIDAGEQLCGFYLIEARDLNEAIRVAARIPAARVGAVEVRPVLQLTGH